MNRAPQVLAFLRGSETYVSGDLIASRLGISRTAVWKCLKQLEELGYAFERRKGAGYRLMATPDRLYPWEIERFLETAYIGRELIYRDSVDSTNALAFRAALEGCKEGTCVAAESQAAGRGRLERQWHSPHGKNLYVSVVLRPQVSPARIYPLSFISSLAAFDTLKAAGVEPRLKWPNDVLVNGRKICGTLIELSVEADTVRFAIIGIGLNINMERIDMDATLREKATSLLMETKNFFERPLICGILLGSLEKYYETARQKGMEELCRLWEERAAVKGTYMEIRQMNTVYRGISEGIDRDGAMLLNENGVVTRVIAGDVVV
ncbi:MAG: biotin--[acetyl-CoA-carboxylase] ligase [Syntrophorhabdales bacterium]|jgi:BirA family biotin operon repressor/biotin-[acetyl-CoA-carboxylase] ligase